MEAQIVNEQKYEMENLITALSSGGLSLILSGALIRLCRNWISERMKGAIQTEYNEKLESHKAQLQAINNAELEKLKAQLQSANDTELEKLRAQLQVAAAERNIKLDKVFEKQADIIATIYAKLFTFRDAVYDYTASIKSNEKEQLDKLNAAYREFQIAFYPNAIYLEQKIADEIHRLGMKLHSLVRHYKDAAYLESQPTTNPARERSIDTRYAAIDKLEPEIDASLKNLVAEFQRVLGILK